MAKRSAEQQKVRTEMSALIAKARAGELKWLDVAIREAGYGDPPGDEVILTSRQIEKGLNLSRRTLQEYLTEGMPLRTKANGNRPATFEVYEVLRWLQSFWRRIASGGMEESEAIQFERRKREADLKRAESDARIKSQEAGMREARLVDRDKVEADVNEILRLLQTRLENAPAVIAAEGVGRKVDELAEIARRNIREPFNVAVDELRRALPPRKE